MSFERFNDESSAAQTDANLNGHELDVTTDSDTRVTGLQATVQDDESSPDVEPDSDMPDSSSSPSSSSLSASAVPRMSFGSLFMLFLGFGLRAWGGPVAHIAMLKDQLVLKDKWITVERFNRVLAVYQILPGPEATELCCYFGLLSRGRFGAFVAGFGFVLPGFLLILLLSFLYTRFGLNNAYFLASFKAIQPAVAAMVVSAVFRIGQHAVLNNDAAASTSGKSTNSGTGAAAAASSPAYEPWLVLIVCLSTLQSTLHINFMITLTFCGLLYVLAKRQPVSLVWPVLWIVAGCVVYVIIIFAIGFPSVNATGFGLVQNVNAGTLFLLGLVAGSITFGGAYTCIPFVQTEVTMVAQWMTKDQFLDGLALSSVIPAPLVIFITFVGYFGGGQMGSGGSGGDGSSGGGPLGYELVGALMTTIGMFLPAFSFTIIGHEYFERAVHNRQISTFLDGVTASVVGLIVTTALELIRSSIRKEPLCVVIFFATVYALMLMTFKHRFMSTFCIVCAALAGQFFFLDEYNV